MLGVEKLVFKKAYLLECLTLYYLTDLYKNTIRKSYNVCHFTELKTKVQRTSVTCRELGYIEEPIKTSDLTKLCR